GNGLGGGVNNVGAAGVMIHDGTWGNTVGGTTAGARNVISGNGGYGGVVIQGANNNGVAGNFIGPEIDANPLGKTGTGVNIVGAQDNTISDNVISSNSEAGVGIGRPNSSGNNILHNQIAENGGPGVAVSDSVNNLIRGNSIYSNTGLGIDLRW